MKNLNKYQNKRRGYITMIKRKLLFEKCSFSKEK